MHKMSMMRVTIATLGAVLLLIFSGGSVADDVRLEQSRDIVSRFASELQAAMRAAMMEGGPTVAIGVCKEQAPTIASRLSRETGAKVARTSSKPRNPLNAPEPWQRTILGQFEQQAAAGAPMPLEYFERVDGDARYLRAIATQAGCLACHGETIADDVRDSIAADYPFDRARGYSLGDIRGAFSVTWSDDTQ